MEFGEKLKELKISHKLSNAQLSRLSCISGIDFSSSAVSYWENGFRSPSIHYLFF